MPSDLSREERLQIMLSPDELAAIDDWRFAQRMPSRAAAIRELIRLGIDAVAQKPSTQGQKSSNYGVLRTDAKSERRRRV
ncbi:MAG TPA: hypothetical protein VLV50_10225 [Stellaceae bacterium]|nr:hypothetical protein [Stellaceae bacterium]